MSLIQTRVHATFEDDEISDSVSLLDSNDFIELVKGTPRFGLSSKRDNVDDF